MEQRDSGELAQCAACLRWEPRDPALDPWEPATFCKACDTPERRAAYERRIRARLPALMDELGMLPAPKRVRKRERVRVTNEELGLERRVETIRDGRLT